MSRKWRALIIAVGLTGAVFGLLPVILMSAPVLTLFKQSITPHVPGRIEMATCSVGWLEGIRCEQVRYVDPSQRFEVTAPQLTGDKGLLALLIAPAYLGEITVHQPVGTFHPPPTEEHQEGSSAEATQVEIPSSEIMTAELPWWQKIGLRFRLQNGQFFFHDGDKPPQLLAGQIDCTGRLVHGSVSYELAFTSPQTDGHLSGSGTFHLPRSGDEDRESLISNTELSVRNLKIDDFLTLASSWEGVPRGSGRLDASLHINAVGLTEAEVRGEIMFHDLRLAGGVLGQDQPRLNELHLNFKGSRRQDEDWRLAALDLQSDLVTLHAAGTFDAGAVLFEAQGQIRAPEMARELPNLLRIHEHTVLDEGVINFSLAMKGQPDQLVIQADCRTDHLRLVHDQQAYSLTMPLHFELEAVHGDQSEVRTLHLRMPFFELKGDSGNEGFVLNGEGDLERMSQELGRLFAMDYQARGHVQVSATSRHDGEERHRLDSRLTVNNFSLLKDDQVVLPAHPLSITAAATAAGLRFDLNSVDDLSLEASIWPGTLSFHVRNMRQCTGPGHDNFSMQTRFDAGRLRNTVQGFFLEKYLAGTEGGVRFEAAGTWCDNVITLQKLRGEIADLTVAGEKAIIREPRVVFGLGGLTAEKAAQQVRLQNLLVVEDWAGFVHKTDPLFQLNIDKRSIEICRFTLSSARAAVELNAGLRDWKQVEAGYSLAVQGEGEDSLVGDVLRVAGLQAPDMNVQGKVRGNWSYRGGGGQGSEQAVFFAVSSLKVTRSRRVLASDPFVTCSLRLEEADEQPFELKMTDFDLRASLMHIAGTGRIIRNEQPNLNLQGQFTPRYVQLKPLLLPYIGPDISLSGTRSGTFQLSLPLTMPVRQEDITVTAELPLDSLRFRDIDLGAVELPLDFHRNQLRVRIDGQLDAGKVSLAPLWDLSASQPTLTLPAKAPCLAGVSPQPPLLDGVLGRLHPLFGVFAQLRGTMDLYINHFSVPITGRGWGSPVFDISLAVDQLRFTPMGPLQELLSLNGYVQEWYPCAEKEIRCQGKAGKVQCAPVHLVADDERVALQGEFGRQQELQYTVRFPLGQALAELIGSDGNEEERSVSAVVTGTRQKPECDIHALVAGLAHELIKSRKAGRYGKQPQADEPVEP